MRIDLSIIIPFFNNYNRLFKLITSIYESAKDNSDYKIELIIINDSPWVNIDLSNFKEEDNIFIRYVKNEMNEGVANTRNKGKKLANGVYITFIDQDDYVLKDYITLVKLNTRNCQTAQIHIVNAFHYWESNSTFSKMYFFKPSFSYNSFLRTCHILTPGFLVFKKEFLIYDFICHSKDFPGSDDWHLYLNITGSEKKIKVNFIKSRVFVYVTHNSNVSNNMFKLIKSSYLTLQGNIHTLPKTSIYKIKLFLLSSILNSYDKNKFNFMFFNSLNKIFGINLNSILYRLLK